MRKNRMAVRHVVLFGLLLWPLEAAAQQSCVNPAFGVPPNGGPPNWWDMIPPQPTYAQQIYDPRWQGAFGVSYGSGTAPQAEFRALHQGNDLYLSWYMSTDGSSEPKIDQISVVFGSLTGTAGPLDPDYRIDVWPRTDPGPSGTELGPAAQPRPAATQLFKRTAPCASLPCSAASLTWTPIAAPTWLSQDMRGWVEPGGWAVAMRVPVVAAGASIPADGIQLNQNQFRLWSEIQVDRSGTIDKYSWPPKVTTYNPPPNFPRLFPHIPATAASCPATGSFNKDNYQPCFWQQTPDQAFIGTPQATTPDGELKLASWPLPATCSNLGVSLSPADVGSKPPPIHQIKYRQTDPHPVNEFYAQPFNNSGMQIDATRLKALFRIANWGSSIDPAHWEDPLGLELWQKIPGDASDPNPGSNDLDIGTGSFGYINVNWTVGAPQLGLLQTGALNTHQCIFVELSSDLTTLKFLNKSVYRNMDYAVPASPFVDKAQISIVGLDSVAGMGPTRTVYLYVEAKNLPKSVGDVAQLPDRIIVPRNPSRLPPDMRMVPATRHTTAGRRGDSLLVSQMDTVPTALWDTLLVPTEASGEREQFLRSAEAAGRLPWRQMDDLMPTYKIHVYHETGDTALVEGVKLPIVRPQTSFGYWVDHRGKLRGWRHRIEGVDTKLEEIAPNFYKLSIPHQGSAAVRIVIKPLEPLPNLVVLLIVLIALLVLALLLCLVKCVRRARHA